MQEVPIPAMACLASPLPEDIANRKASGDWDGAIALIDERLRTQNSSLQAASGARNFKAPSARLSG